MPLLWGNEASGPLLGLSLAAWTSGPLRSDMAAKRLARRRVDNAGHAHLARTALFGRPR